MQMVLLFIYSIHYYSLVSPTAEAVWTIGTGGLSTNQQWHFGLDSALSLPTDAAQQAVHGRPAAAALLHGAVWGQHHHAHQRHRCVLLLHQQQPAAQNLRRPQQIRHPQRSQARLHRRHALQASQVSRGSHQGGPAQQHALRKAQRHCGQHQDSSPAVPLARVRQRHDGKGAGARGLHTAVPHGAQSATGHVSAGVNVPRDSTGTQPVLNSLDKCTLCHELFISKKDKMINGQSHCL